MRGRDLHEDCRFWGLTRMQCIHHHARSADMYSKITKKQADRLIASSTRSLRAVIMLAVLAVGLAILSILS